jgi:hypothetical protein
MVHCHKLRYLASEKLGLHLSAGFLIKQYLLVEQEGEQDIVDETTLHADWSDYVQFWSR